MQAVGDGGEGTRPALVVYLRIVGDGGVANGVGTTRSTKMGCRQVKEVGDKKWWCRIVGVGNVSQGCKKWN